MENSSIQAIENTKHNMNNEIIAIKSERDNFKLHYMELERQHQEVSANYEKDSLLWQGKLSFLEQQKSQAKSDLEDAHNKFEAAFLQIQKRGEHQKEKLDLSHKALIDSVESRYQITIRDLEEK